MKYLKAIMIILMAESALTATATAGDGDKTVVPRVLRSLMFVKNRIDTMAVKGIDRRYIDVPKQPWQVVVRGNINQTELEMKSDIDLGKALVGTPLGYNMRWEPLVKNAPSTYVGVWAGYRGTGVGYSKNVAGDKGSYLTFSSMGGKFGANLRIHRFNTYKPSIHYKSDVEDLVVDSTEVSELDDPIRVNTVILDGYYLFNWKRFSYASAYKQSTVQQRSAGSFIAGAMYYYSHIDFATESNAPLILFMDDIGQIRQWQLCFGAGYAYNWVPARGWLVSAIFMPMLTTLNRLKTYKYKTNVPELLFESEDAPDEGAFIIEPTEAKVENSRPRLNFDTRLSLTYQWNRYYVNAYGHINNFKYKQDNNWGRLTDWQACIQLGVRF